MTNQEIDVGRDSQGQVLPGHAFWRMRKTHGRDRLYTDPEALWADCCDYFDTTHLTPMLEDKVCSSEGSPVHVSVAKMRPFTITGLCFHLHIATETWRDCP